MGHSTRSSPGCRVGPVLLSPPRPAYLGGWLHLRLSRLRSRSPWEGSPRLLALSAAVAARPPAQVLYSPPGAPLAPACPAGSVSLPFSSHIWVSGTRAPPPTSSRPGSPPGSPALTKEERPGLSPGNAGRAVYGASARRSAPAPPRPAAWRRGWGAARSHRASGARSGPAPELRLSAAAPPRPVGALGASGRCARISPLLRSGSLPPNSSVTPPRRALYPSGGAKRTGDAVNPGVPGRGGRRSLPPDSQRTRPLPKPELPSPEG